MMPISGVNTGAIQPLTTAEKVLGAPKVQKSEEDSQGADPPKQPEGAPEKPNADEEPDPAGQGAKGPEGKKDEVWEGNSDKVDREIEKLKKKQQELAQQLNTETDEAKIKELERQLSQVEQELRQKDNDAYRRQHTKVRQLS